MRPFRMAPHEQLMETDNASHSSGASKALGVLAAISAGGLMAMRMKPTPLMFLAGAAAVAFLGRKRIVPASRPLELLPQRPPEPAPSPRVEVDAWLARQVEREQQTPVITLDVETLPETIPPAPEPLETAKAALPEVFPFWSMPAEQPAIAPIEPFLMRQAETDGAGFLFPSEPVPEPLEESPAPFLNLDPAPASAPSNASWLLGIEPLPSWDELTTAPNSSPPTPTSDFAFLAEPPGATSYTPQPAPEPTPPPATPAPPPPIQPLFIPSLFQGGALPDEITVTEEPAPAPVVEPAAPSLEAFTAFEAIPFPAPPPPPAPIEPVPEPEISLSLPELVPVTLASPGEATFDDPLAALEENPSSIPGGLPPPPPLRPHAPVIEAEIVVRPRGFGASRDQPKEPEAAPVEPVEPPSLDTPFLASEPPASPAPPIIPPAPVVLPREQKARKTWRSWWRGD
ncbi:MAG: hypothetical protein IPK22_27735 [Verrucomicrobiaceae bacterium]|nr:hypothetical protein [Verrucomicrobiaceae bacterium]